jgi:hypothetical protein
MRFYRLLLLLLLVAPATPAAAYSVLTHQSIIDSTWTDCLLPLLRQRYPGATPDQLVEAKSYAYGGAIIQDMGYYPLGATLFTNLTHYVRSGDFVRNLLRQAHDRNEYAFALGALAHYASDNLGHPDATNLILPQVYPEKKAQFGPVVTYEQAPINHTEVEFSFDVVAIAAGRYRSQDYHKYIGFRVSKPLLERGFQQTYGLELGQVLFNVDAAIGRQPGAACGGAGRLAQQPQADSENQPAGSPPRLRVPRQPAPVSEGVWQGLRVAGLRRAHALGFAKPAAQSGATQAVCL